MNLTQEAANILEYGLKSWQDNFIFSPARFPAMFSSWATGKTMSLIFRAQIYTDHIPDNLGVIFRKEYVDLRDSTCKDYEKYTGLKITSSREVKTSNGSTILFRHLEELNNIQNMNLGWFAIEQGDEVESDKEFFMLFGRLRRKVNPSEAFKKMGLPERSGFVIGNAGDHWGRKIWKGDIDEAPMEQSELFEATTWNNMENLTPDFLNSLMILKKRNPPLYKKFVENDWSIGADQYVLITNQDIAKLKDIQIHVPLDRYLVSLDPATGGDECVYKVFKNTKEIDQMILHERDGMKVVGHGMILMAKHKIDDIAIDVVGLGGPIADRFAEQGKTVHRFDSRNSASDERRFGNAKSEAWWECMEDIQDGKCEYISDEITRKQLTETKYRVIKSNGKILMEHKEDTKKRIQSSPDRADCYVQAIKILKKVIPRVEQEAKKRQDAIKKDPYNNNSTTDYPYNPATV